MRLLLIEDVPEEAEWLQQALIQVAAPETLYVEWQQQLASGLNQLTLAGFDAILLDLNLPDSQGLETLTRVQRSDEKIPVVILVDKGDCQIAALAMQIGAQDCLVKGSINACDLLRTIQHAIERKRFELTLERRTRELAALYETSLEINAQIDLPRLLNALVERALHLMGLPLGGLYLVRADNKSLSLEYIVNMKEDYRGTVLQFGEGVSGRVAQTGLPLAVANYQKWEGRAKIYEGSEFQRVLAVPLKACGQVIGVIILSDEQNSGGWSAEEIRLASLFADQAAIAVHNARLLDAERQKSAELSRSNAVIAAVGQMATRLGETLDTQLVLETLGNDLQRLGVMVGLSLFEGAPKPELVVRYLSVEHQQLFLVETMLEQRIIGARISSDVYPLADYMVTERKGYYQKDPIPHLMLAFPGISSATLEAALARINIFHSTPVLFLPLMIKDHPLGMMMLWGGDLRENDLLAFTVFASQVAVALENARLYNRIERQATLDELTGLYNRRGFFLLAEQQLRVAHRTGSEMLLIFCDVDQLKQINDTHGHKEGDRALSLTADAMRATFRSADIVARISGDEFAILTYSSPGVSAPSLMDRLRREVGRINSYSENLFTLGLSAGYSLWSPSKPATLDELLAQADAQMYQVKRKKTTGELNSSSISQ